MANNERQVVLTIVANTDSDMALSEADIAYYVTTATETAAQIVERHFAGLVIVRGQSVQNPPSSTVPPSDQKK